MPTALIEYITAYGYPTVFAFIFLQEMGIPSPVPTELVLMFSGYLASIGRLDTAKLITLVVIADCLGTIALYAIFYRFGPAILKRAPKWLAVSRIEALEKRLEGKGQWKVYIGRLIPYVRGYTSVAAGVMRLPPKIYLPAVALSALIWSGGYVTIGRLAGSRWEKVAETFGPRLSLGLLAFAIILVVVGPMVYDRFTRRTKT